MMTIGTKYRIRYRQFNSKGQPTYNSPLMDGVGTLISKYSAGNYNHTFQLEGTNTEVWATPNSVFPLDLNTPSHGTIIDDIVGPSSDDVKSLTAVSSFLRGLGVQSIIADERLIISASAAGHFKKVLYKMYKDLLIEEDEED